MRKTILPREAALAARKDLTAISLYTLHFDEFFNEDAKVLVGIDDLYGVHKMYDVFKFIL